MASVKKSKEYDWTGRLEGLKKKIGQLTTLCDVDGFLVCVDRRDPSSVTSSCTPPLFPGYSWPEDRTEFCSVVDKYQQTVASSLSSSAGSLMRNKRKRNDGKINEEGFLRKPSSKKLKKDEEIDKGFLDYLNQVIVVGDGDDGLGFQENSSTIFFEKAGNSEAYCYEIGELHTMIDAVKPEDLGSVLDEIRKRKAAVKERIEYLSVGQYLSIDDQDDEIFLCY